MTPRWVLLAVGASIAGCQSGTDATLDPSLDTASDVPHVLEANATVADVIDGDTIDVVVDGRPERVRLIGIDTPETKRPDAPIECFGPEASEFTTDLLPIGTAVRIERDVVNRDDYGRLLGYVHRAVDGIFVNYEIIRQGFAAPLSIGPNTTYEAVFVEAARAAEADDVGLWSACAV